MCAETPSCFSHQHFLTESYARRPLTGDPSLIPPYGDRAKRKWLRDEELPAPPTKLGDVVIRTATPLGTKFAKFTVWPANTKSWPETSSAENVGVPVEPATPVIIPVDLRKVAIGLPDEKPSKLAKLPAGDAGGPLK